MEDKTFAFCCSLDSESPEGATKEQSHTMLSSVGHPRLVEKRASHPDFCVLYQRLKSLMTILEPGNPETVHRSAHPIREFPCKRGTPRGTCYGEAAAEPESRYNPRWSARHARRAARTRVPSQSPCQCPLCYSWALQGSSVRAQHQSVEARDKRGILQSQSTHTRDQFTLSTLAQIGGGEYQRHNTAPLLTSRTHFHAWA